ncbi:hypothetical protein DERF_011116 [Dermatophagoides farinae]|uniref:Transmembrane protein n=1 Tax=Dermatophagoides farinae TaxID=6954 RepID=A0A922KZZ7_DERFA|nr:hypothetical protein DERF_011116 [Dermatophagoides farinae]
MDDIENNDDDDNRHFLENRDGKKEENYVKTRIQSFDLSFGFILDFPSPSCLLRWRTILLLGSRKKNSQSYCTIVVDHDSLCLVVEIINNIKRDWLLIEGYIAVQKKSFKYLANFTNITTTLSSSSSSLLFSFDNGFLLLLLLFWNTLFGLTLIGSMSHHHHHNRYHHHHYTGNVLLSSLP